MKEVTVEYRVTYADTDMMGVVYHANYLVFFERARNEFMRQLGYPYTECEKAGVMMPIIHVELNYKRPAKYDDLIEITARVAARKGVKLKLDYVVRRKGESEDLVTGSTTLAYVSSQTFRPCYPPPAMAEALKDC